MRIIKIKSLLLFVYSRGRLITSEALSEVKRSHRRSLVRCERPIILGEKKDIDAITLYVFLLFLNILISCKLRVFPFKPFITLLQRQRSRVWAALPYLRWNPLPVHCLTAATSERGYGVYLPNFCYFFFISPSLDTGFPPALFKEVLVLTPEEMSAFLWSSWYLTNKITVKITPQLPISKGARDSCQ